MLKRFTAILIMLCLAVGAGRPAAAQANDPATVIQMVNDLRAEYGLPPYTVNPILMGAAQSHSEWAASVGTHSHTGRGGTTPQDRAVAAGYGGGQRVRVSENIYWGSNATASSALGWWRNSSIHFAGMTSTQYTEIGAGVAYSEYGGFFTLKFGVVLPENPVPPAQNSSGGNAPAASGPVYNVEPVELAEPNEDGSLVHTVGEGQNIWVIAEAYDLPVSEVLALNYLSEDSVIYPGDELIIVPAPVKVSEEPEGPLYHTVQSGQTPVGIARAYGIELETLLDLNNLTELSIIYPDDELLIRPGEPEPAPTAIPATDPPPATATPRPTPTPSPTGVLGETVEEEPVAAPRSRSLLVGGLALVGLTGVGLIAAGGFLIRE